MRWLVLVVVGACGFRHGALSGDDVAPPLEAGPDTDAVIDGPVDAASTACAVEVTASSAHTCARKTDGSVWCWGKNGQGETSKDPQNSAVCTVSGNDYACVKTPRQAPLSAPATAMGAGDQHTCVLVGTKTYCFGANDGGQFGNGMAGDSYNPVEVTARASSTQIAGSEASTCSLIGGNVACSGTNNHGEVGNGGTTIAYTPYVAQVGATTLAMGFRNTCTISNAFVFCWGDNADRQIDTTTTPRYFATAVPGAPQSVDVAVGFGHVCARSSVGDVTCWGRNAEGQIGTGATSITLPPTLVSVGPVVQLAAGAYHTCARLANGDVECWGESYGPSPTAIALPMPAVSLAAGSYHGRAALVDGSLWCWGWNPYSQLGNNATSTQVINTPVKAVVCP